MCFTALKRKISNDRYKRYAEAKAKIPKNLSAEKYEAAVKRLAKIYRI